MLSIDIRALDSQAAAVAGSLSAEDAVWVEGDIRPREGVFVEGRLSTAGAGRYYFSGRLSGSLEMPCRRCLKPAEAAVREDLHLLFAETGAEEADDPDVFVISPHAPELALRPAIREQWLLAAPPFLECGEQCRGLRARCGADLNEGPCDCPPETDTRWSALRSLGERTQ
ncbi:MAG TPA: DUF177 domain-containing protein [Gemmatimonadaceae bacterium]|nr:DUF177 domain-containing protein [Gemmatimonadaceae bacterium]